MSSRQTIEQDVLRLDIPMNEACDFERAQCIYDALDNKALPANAWAH